MYNLPLDEIEKSWLNGESCTDIAKGYNVSHWAIRSRLRQMGIWKRTVPVASRTIPDLTEIEAARIATWIDSEGTIGFYHRNDSPTRAPQVFVQNTYKPLIDWLSSFCGIVGQREAQTTGKVRGNKSVYTWKVSRQADVLFLLRMVEPYLMEKREKAKKVISYIEKRLGI